VRSKSAVLLIVLALAFSACTSGSQPTKDSRAPGETPTSAASGGDSTSPSPSTPLDAAVDLPLLPILWTATDLAEPGTETQIVGDARLSGEVTLLGPDGDLSSARMDAGVAMLSIPIGLGAGRYGLRLGDGDAVGTVTVVDAPGVVVVGAGYTRSDAAPEVEVIVHGLGEAMIAAVETRGNDGTVERLIPHPMLGLAPMQTSAAEGLSEGRHRLKLPVGFEGVVRVVAGPADVVADPYAEIAPTVVSADLRIQVCDEPSGIVGDLGSAGVVSVRTEGLSTPVVRARVDAGAFQLSLEPGWSLVSVMRDDGTVPAGSPQLVKVGCGVIVDVGDLETMADLGPAPGEYLGGLTVDDVWAYTTNATGDISFQQEGFTDCSVAGGALEVALGSGSADPWLYTLTIGPPLDTGHYQGALHFDDVLSGGSADGILDGEIEVGRVDGLDAIGGAFSGSIEGTLGVADIQIHFTCAVASLSTSVQPAGGIAMPGGLFASGRLPAPLALQIGGGIRSGKECKKLMIDGSEPEGADETVEMVMGYWATMLMPEVPRLSIITTDEIRMFLDIEAKRELFGSDPEVSSIDFAGAVGSDFLLSLNLLQVGDFWSLKATLFDLAQARVLARMGATGASAEAATLAILDRWVELAEPLTKAGICAEFDPDSVLVDVGQVQDFTIEVTDLAGEPPESAEVLEFATSCGTWKPSSGAVDGDRWKTQFTAGDKACAENALLRVSVVSPNRSGSYGA